MPRQTIRNEGAGAESEFLHRVVNSKKTDLAKKGDAIVTCDGVPHYVEIKSVESNTVNQVRAIKFITLAILSPQEARPWAVVPAHEVVRLVYEKERGQHTEIALESANMTLSGIPPRFRVSSDELSDAVHNAIKESKKYDALAKLLHDLLKDIRQMKADYQSKVAEALRLGDMR